MEGPVTSVAFCPNAELTLLAVSYEGHQIALLNTGCGDRLLVANTEKFLKEVANFCLFLVFLNDYPTSSIVPVKEYGEPRVGK